MPRIIAVARRGRSPRWRYHGMTPRASEASCSHCDSLARELSTLREFVDRCRELGDTDTDIVKHALEDQERLKEVGIELSTLRARMDRDDRLRTELSDAHKALDDIGAPREDGGGVLTLAGRCWALSNRWAEEQSALSTGLPVAREAGCAEADPT